MLQTAVLPYASLDSEATFSSFFFFWDSVVHEDTPCPEKRKLAWMKEEREQNVQSWG